MLHLENVSIVTDCSQVVHNMNISVMNGEIVALLGPEKAEKSSILKAIMGLYSVSTGRIIFEGRSITGMEPEQIAAFGIALASSGGGVFYELSVDENLHHEMSAHRDMNIIARTKAKIFAMFPALASHRNQCAGTLTKERQYQLTIAVQLMSEPALLLLDEPSCGLTPQEGDEIFCLIAELRKNGITILLTEKGRDRALKIADRFYLVENGQITGYGNKAVVRGEGPVKPGYRRAK